MSQRYQKSLTILLSCLLCMWIAGCSNESSKEPTSENKTKAKETNKVMEDSNSNTIQSPQTETVFKEVPEQEPVSLQEVLSFPSGQFSGNTYDENKEEIEKVLSQFPNLEETASEEDMKQYWGNLLRLFSESYPDPQSIMEQLKIKSFGNPQIKDPRYQYKEQLNVEVILDASGSMAGKVNGITIIRC